MVPGMEGGRAKCHPEKHDRHHFVYRTESPK
jgi:hypothetical protein